MNELEYTRLQLQSVTQRYEALLTTLATAIGQSLPPPIYVQFTPKRDAMRETPMSTGTGGDSAFVLCYLKDDDTPFVGWYHHGIDAWYEGIRRVTGCVVAWRELPSDELPALTPMVMNDDEIFKTLSGVCGFPDGTDRNHAVVEVPLESLMAFGRMLTVATTQRELTDAEIDTVWHNELGFNSFGFISTANVRKVARAFIAAARR